MFQDIVKKETEKRQQENQALKEASEAKQSVINAIHTAFDEIQQTLKGYYLKDGLIPGLPIFTRNPSIKNNNGLVFIGHMDWDVVTLSVHQDEVGFLTVRLKTISSYLSKGKDDEFLPDIGVPELLTKFLKEVASRILI